LRGNTQVCVRGGEICLIFDKGKTVQGGGEDIREEMSQRGTRKKSCPQGGSGRVITQTTARFKNSQGAK